MMQTLIKRSVIVLALVVGLSQIAFAGRFGDVSGQLGRVLQSDAAGRAFSNFVGDRYRIRNLPSVDEIFSGRFNRAFADSQQRNWTRVVLRLANMGDAQEARTELVILRDATQGEIRLKYTRAIESVDTYIRQSARVESLVSRRHATSDAESRVRTERASHLRVIARESALDGVMQESRSSAVTMAVTKDSSVARGTELGSATIAMASIYTRVFRNVEGGDTDLDYVKLQKIHDRIQAEIDQLPSPQREVASLVNKNTDPSVLFALRSLSPELTLASMLEMSRLGLAVVVKVGDVDTVRAKLDGSLPEAYVRLVAKVNDFTSSLVARDSGDGQLKGGFKDSEEAHNAFFTYFVDTFAPHKLGADSGSLGKRLAGLSDAEKAELMKDVVRSEAIYAKLNLLLKGVQDSYVKRMRVDADDSEGADVLRRHTRRSIACAGAA